MPKVTRGDVSSIVLPDQVSETLLRGTVERSEIASIANVEPMTADSRVFTEAEVGDASVFWVGEGARKTTIAPGMTNQSWTMDAAEVAVIIPIDENVYDDANVDLFELYQDKIETAFARKLDKATLFGGADWPVAWNVATGPADGSIYEICKTAATIFEEDGDPTDAELLDLLSGTGAVAADGALQSLEDDGYDPNGFLAAVKFRARLRALKDADGRYIYGDAVGTGVPATLFGVPIDFVATKGGRFDAAKAHLFAGAWEQAYLGIKQGVKYKVFDQGVITDGAGNVTYSLMENDMIALRMTARVGFKVIADELADGETLSGTSDVPFSIVGPAGAATA